MKNIILIVLLFPALTAHCQSKGTTGDVADVRIIDSLLAHSKYSKVWQPYIAIVDSANYIATYGIGIQGKTDMGNIVASVSKDKGNNWSPAITIFDSETGDFAYANSFFYKDLEQDILWCYAMECPKFYKNSEESQLVAAYSPDKGFTWIRVPLSVDFHSPLITNASILRTKDGKGVKYLLAVHRNTLQSDPNGDRRQFILESRDLLKWKLSGFIPMPKNKLVFLCEGNMAFGPNDKDIEIVMRSGDYDNPGRNQLDPPRAYSSISNDNGKTWSVAKEEPDLWNTYSKGFFGKDSKGRYIYVYNDGPIRRRTSLMYIVKENGKWSKPSLFYWDNNRNSYPTLVEESPGNFICVWDSSNDLQRARTVIRFGRLTLN